MKYIFFRKENNTEKQAKIFGEMKVWIQKFVSEELPDDLVQKELIKLLKEKIDDGDEEEGEWAVLRATAAGFSEMIRLGEVGSWW